jgi:hypothetical protein
MEIIGLAFMAFLCFFFASLLEENLNQKFVKIGVFNKNTYNDFVKKIRNPNQIAHQDNYIVAQWYTSNNWFKQNYNIVLVFDKQGNFISKQQETFFQGTPPNIWVGVRF